MSLSVRILEAVQQLETCKTPVVEKEVKNALQILADARKCRKENS